MKVVEAKQLVLELLHRDKRTHGAPVMIDPTSPDSRDPGKFVLAGKTARAIHHYDGWYVPINLDWFHGSYDHPRINRGEFFWYVFAIPRLLGRTRDHYLVCDYLQIRDWVLSFLAPQGRDHRDHHDWRADIRVDHDDLIGAQAYFRWGDEPVGQWVFPERIVALDNIAAVANENQLRRLGMYVGNVGPTGESEAHIRLKRFVADNPVQFSLHETAESEIEHRFITGDRVDVMFRNHDPSRTVAEIEIAGTENIIVGIHQAIKYRVLAAAESGYALDDPRELAAFVVSYDGGGPQAEEIADAYGVTLHTVDREKVLAPSVA